MERFKAKRSVLVGPRTRQGVGRYWWVPVALAVAALTLASVGAEPACAGEADARTVLVFTHFQDDGSVTPSTLPCAGGQAIHGHATFGLQVFLGEIYVSNSDQGTILAIPIKPNGTAGRIRVHATLPDDLGCDDFAFDILGNLYCTTDPFNKLLRIFPDGSFATLLTAADGLDGPTAAAFGRQGQDRSNLYITNAAFPFFSTTHHPSLMRLHLEVPGWPKP
jgi:SMP-30/Gluconolactonase/LRE-like region